MEHVVEKVIFDKETNKVKVSGKILNGNTSTFEFIGDCAVITVPLGVLKEGNIIFDPELPAKKQESIKRLGMGALNKVVLPFKKQFWPDNTLWLGHCSPNGRFPWFLNLCDWKGVPVLVAFWSKDAKEIEKMSDQETYDEVLGILSKRFGEEVKDLFIKECATVTRWISDPYSRGSYSFTALGSGGPDFEELGRPVVVETKKGKKLYLCFAGEATDQRYYGCAHAAYFSGEREGQRIVKHFSNRKE